MKKRYLLLFVVILLGSLLWQAPATLLDQVAQHYSQKKVLLAEASGSVWHGTATPVVITSEGTQLKLPKISWQLDWLALFSGKPTLLLRNLSQTDDMPMSLVLNQKQLQLHHINLPLPAQALSELSPHLKPIQLGGELVLQSELLSLSQTEITGQATILWSKASSGLTNVSPLGNYKINVNGSGQQLNIQLSTVDGALILNGGGQLNNGKLNFNGTAQAHPDEQERLKELLQYLGPRISPGVHRIGLM